MPLKSIVKRFDFGDAYYCLPDPAEPDITFRQFALFAAALDAGPDGEEWAMLGRLTFNSLPRRLAVVSVDGVLVAETLQDKRELPYDVRARLPTPNPSEVAQLRAFLKTLWREDADFPADADPVEALIAARIEAFRAKEDANAVTALSETLRAMAAKAGGQ